MTSALGSATPSAAQNRQQMAANCLSALASNDQSKTTQLAKEIELWENLFGPKIIREAEECLVGSTGKFWKYFTTKGKFLSGEAAQKEQASIDGADARKLQRELERKTRECKVLGLRNQLSEMEKQLRRTEAERKVETSIKTWSVCSEKYRLSKEDALLEPVCNALFMSEGLPDSSSGFDYVAFQDTKLKLLIAELDLAEQLQPDQVKKSSKSNQASDCIAFLE